MLKHFIPPKVNLLIRSEFRCTEIAEQDWIVQSKIILNCTPGERGYLSNKTTSSLQKGWSYTGNLRAITYYFYVESSGLHTNVRILSLSTLNINHAFIIFPTENDIERRGSVPTDSVCRKSTWLSVTDIISGKYNHSPSKKRK